MLQVKIRWKKYNATPWNEMLGLKAGVKTNFFHHRPENVLKNILNRPESSRIPQKYFLHF